MNFLRHTQSARKHVKVCARMAYSTALPQNYVEKIVQRFSLGLGHGHVVQAGDFVTISPKHVMTHDNTGAVMGKFNSLKEGISFRNPKQPVFTLDHDIQNVTKSNVEKYAKIAAFAKKHGVDAYPAGRGIGHQVMVEEGYVMPGTLVVASDSHSNMYGGVGALGTPVVRTDAAAIWATGCTWWTVPPVARVTFTGALQPGVSGKDVIVTLCGLFNKDEVLNHAVEFVGTVEGLTVDDRLAIANMTTEWGALAGVFPCDGVTMAWFANRVQQKGPGNNRLTPQALRALEADWTSGGLAADPDAFYCKDLTLDLSSVQPSVSGPNAVKKYSSVATLAPQKVAIQKAYIVSCTNSRVADLASAASVLRGTKVAAGVELYVAAASSEVQAESEQLNDWQAILEAGGKPLPPGCGPCIGLGAGLLEDGEVGISATNRNFKGRMGHPGSLCYLASPEVVAASAVAGYITGPRSFDASLAAQATCTVNKKVGKGKTSVELLPNFPEKVTGDVVFCHQDNLNTDGIYPGKYTYKDDITPEEQAKVVMENYDPEFSATVKTGDVLVGGYNFGSGSSREQAATALKYRGIPLVLAGSYSETFKRNAFNNGFIAIECAELVEEIKGTHQGDLPVTLHTKEPITVDFRECVVTFRGKEFPIGALGTTAQELILSGGLEGWVQSKL
uniref:Homoaconitase, mitochondrial n=1 Tax=Eutreptiella gymnastica TaxID=73025 RepID=A0A7S1N7H6_9EUGL|mmetsp:Transcript_133770/g.232065  ORF Transcript_133770/g.232065 Transcript_133770/m.232065 type:complete len:673 (+) Transcript_133770:136-2154(+)